MDEMVNIIEQLHQFREMLKETTNNAFYDPDYEEFMLEKEAEISQLTTGDLESVEENKSNVAEPEPEKTWNGLLRQANNVPPPVISRKPTLGNAILDYALRKSVEQVEFVGLPRNEIQDKILKELYCNRVAKKTAVSTIRFLRDINSSLFTDCPECDYENEPGWLICDNCHAENNN